jgi:hypothetical protein
VIATKALLRGTELGELEERLDAEVEVLCANATADAQARMHDFLDARQRGRHNIER